MRTEPLQPDISVVIPTFNERSNLPVLLERVDRALSAAGYRFEVFIVDDDSPDGTWRIAESLRARFPWLRVIRRTSGARGLAPAVVEGWSRSQGRVLAAMDADLQHPPEVLGMLLAAFNDPSVDVAVASRYTAEGTRLRWNPIRRWVSRGGSNLAQAVLPAAAHAVTDPMSGFFALRREVLDGVSLQVPGYKILLEVLGRGRYRRVVEAPYRFGSRYRGRSKLTAWVLRDYLVQLARLAWTRLSASSWGRPP